MKRISALVLILTSSPAFVNSGHVVRHPANPHVGQHSSKRSLFEVKHMSHEEAKEWNDYIVGYADHHPAHHSYVSVDSVDAKHEESKSKPHESHDYKHEESKTSIESYDDTHAWASSGDEYDYEPWVAPESPSSEDLDPWVPDGWSDEDAWGEYIAGYPDATEPKGDKKPKATKAPKGAKGTKGVKGGHHGYRAEALDYIHTHHMEPEGEFQYHYKPVHMPPRPRPVTTDHHDNRPLIYADGDDEKRVVVPFELQYRVENARKPKLHELDLISLQTAVFIESYLEQFFDIDLHEVVSFNDFELIIVGEPIVGHGIIALDFHGIAFFDKDGEVPSVADLSDLLEYAFTGDSVDQYIKRITSPHYENSPLKDSIFSSTQEVSILTRVPDHEPSKLMQRAEESEAKSIVNSSSPGGSSTSGISLVALTSIVAAAALIAVAVAFVVYRKTEKNHDHDDDLSFIEGVFIGDQGCAVENEIGDEDFEVSSVSSNNATRAENFLRLVARDEDDDDGSGSSRFKIEMGGNKAFSKAK